MNYGRGTHVIDASEVDDDVLSRLRDAFRSPGYEPPMLPAAALQLLEITRRPDTSYSDVLRLMEGDPLIAGKVLRVAQSPVYLRGEPVRTLEQALQRLGMTTLAQIFLQVTMTARVFRAQGYEGPMEALRKHAVAVAQASRLIARQTSMSDEMAFLCGLLHDIGAAMSLIVLADVRPPKRPPEFEHVRKAVGEVHSDASALLCDLWKLSPEIRMILSHHHSPVIKGMAHPIACIVVLADELATQSGFPAPIETIYMQDVAAKALGIDERAWQRLKADFGALAPALR